MGEFSGFPLEEKISQMWRAVPDDAEDKYADNWLEAEYGSLDADQGFLAILTWGPHPPARRKAVWAKVKTAYQEMGVPLHKLTSDQREKLVACYPLRKGWQGKFLRGMILHLGNSGLTLEEFAAKLKEAGPGVARAALQDVFGTSSSKVIDCYLRDILRLDAFPIDAKVRKVLARYNIPPDSYGIVAVCQRMEIPVRILARAVQESAVK